MGVAGVRPVCQRRYRVITLGEGEERSAVSWPRLSYHQWFDAVDGGRGSASGYGRRRSCAAATVSIVARGKGQPSAESVLWARITSCPSDRIVSTASRGHPSSVITV